MDIVCTNKGGMFMYEDYQGATAVAEPKVQPRSGLEAAVSATPVGDVVADQIQRYLAKTDIQPKLYRQPGAE